MGADTDSVVVAEEVREMVEVGMEASMVVVGFVEGSEVTKEAKEVWVANSVGKEAMADAVDHTHMQKHLER